MHFSMAVSSIIARLVARSLPPTEAEDDTRATVFVATVYLVAALSVLSVVLAAGSALWVLAGINVVSLLICSLALRGFRQPGRGLRVVRAFLWYFTFALPLGALATTPIELTMLGYLIIIPIMAATMLPAAETRRWVVRVVVAGTLATLAGEAGLTVAQVDPLPTVTHVMNFVAALAAAMALLEALTRDRERSVQRLQETERAKGAFFANVGHEIRTPMNGVLGMTDALLQRPLDAGSREMALTIRSSGQVMLALVDDLLDLSKLEARRLVLHDGPVALAPLGQELLAFWRPLAVKKGLELVVSVAAELPPAVRLDGLRLRQILGNLLSNAIKFTQEGSVWLRIDSSGGALACTVADTGIGISEAQQRQLFTRFGQADDARARRYQGSGLGLALSRELATHMGGAITVASTPGEGSRFTCTLPLVEAALEVAVAVPTGALPSGLRVLIVDDNAVNRLVARRLLDMSGCLVEAVADGQSAVSAVRDGAFDVVLMDVHMPDVDGLEATRRIRALGDGGVLPIIGVSASAATEDVESCRAAGMNDFLAKPVTRERLMGALLRHVPGARPAIPN